MLASWIVAQINQLLAVEYDLSNDFDTISDYITYVNFDPTPYPNFMKRVAGQGFENRTVMELPYRCNR